MAQWNLILMLLFLFPFVSNSLLLIMLLTIKRANNRTGTTSSFRFCSNELSRVAFSKAQLAGHLGLLQNQYGVKILTCALELHSNF